ncbi:MAG: MoaD/ThiS family protein [Pseudomonadales bacterium]|nr:MoaD/ThiS family protein [Pseudomonadales bacterium]
MMKVLFFAKLREQLGIGHFQIDAKANQITSLATLLSYMHESADALGFAPNALQVLPRNLPLKTLLVSVNQNIVEAGQQQQQLLRETDEIAFFPPVTGG